MKKPRVVIKAEDGAELPVYSTLEAAGADLCAHIEEKIVLQPGDTMLVPTGLMFDIPAGFEIQIRPRSGLALKYGLTVLNTPGTIDSDYRGEVKVILINHGKKPFVIHPKMRIAQCVLTHVFQADFVSEESLARGTRQPTLGSEKCEIRGTGGFGHTGI